MAYLSVFDGHFAHETREIQQIQTLGKQLSIPYPGEPELRLESV